MGDFKRTRLDTSVGAGIVERLGHAKGTTFDRPVYVDVRLLDDGEVETKIAVIRSAGEKGSHVYRMSLALDSSGSAATIRLDADKSEPHDLQLTPDEITSINDTISQAQLELSLEDSGPDYGLHL